MGTHAAAAIPRDRFERAWVVASKEDHPCAPEWTAARLETVINSRAAEGMGTSVALAAAHAEAQGLDGLMIALADMPVIPREHFSALVAEVSSPMDIFVSCKDGARMPPAFFGSGHFAALQSLGGDRGAHNLLAQGRVVACPPEWLADIDTPGDLDELE